MRVRRSTGHRPPAIGVSKIGTITLNPAAIEAMGHPEAIDLSYDEGKLYLAPSSIVEGYEVKNNRQGVQYRLNCRGFVRDNNIKSTDGRPLRAKNIGGILEIDV